MKTLVAPLTAHAALIIALIGVAAVFIAGTFPPHRPSAPRDWDAFAWRLWLERQRPRESWLREYRRALFVLAFSVINPAREAVSRTKARWRWRTRRAVRGLRSSLRTTAAERYQLFPIGRK